MGFLLNTTVLTIASTSSGKFLTLLPLLLLLPLLCVKVQEVKWPELLTQRFCPLLASYGAAHKLHAPKLLPASFTCGKTIESQ